MISRAYLVGTVSNNIILNKKRFIEFKRLFLHVVGAEGLEPPASSL